MRSCRSCRRSNSPSAPAGASWGAAGRASPLAARYSAEASRTSRRCYRQGGQQADSATNIDQELGRRLWELLQEEAADLGYEMSSVQVNKNFPGQAHRDRNDTDHQWACSLGDFTGGTLCWTEQSCEESWEFCADTRRAWTMLDGRHLHWVTPHDGGDRYSLVLFQNTLHPPRPIYYCSEAQALNRKE